MLEEERYQANLKGLLPFIYIIPSYIAHFVVLFTIYRPRNKNSLRTIFFKIYAISAIQAILGSIFLYPYSRMRYTPCLLFFFDAMPERSFFGTFLYTASFYFIFTELLMSFVQNFNRATIIFFKVKYEQFWNATLYSMCFVILFFSALLCSHLWITDVSLQLVDPKDKDKGYDWSARQKISWFRNSYNIAGIVSFVAIGSLFSHLYVVHYFVTKNKQSFATEKEKRKNSAENRLFLFAIISFLFHAVYAAFQIMFIIVTDKSTIYFLIGIQAYVQDFINLSPPWLLLFVCPQVRKRIYFGKNHSNESTTGAPKQPQLFNIRTKTSSQI